MEAKSKHYRVRAQQSQKIAKGVKDPDAKAHLLDVAQQYEMLAAEAEARGL